MERTISKPYRHPRESGGPGQPSKPWTPGFPLFAGMTNNPLILPDPFSANLSNLVGEIIVSSEVILGYTTLGLLLSVLAQNIARRS